MAVFTALALTSCSTDVSRQSPHRELIGTRWKLTEDAYAVSDGGFGPTAGNSMDHVLILCRDEELGGGKFDAGRIGTRKGFRKIEAGYRKGSVFEVKRVLRTPGLLMEEGYRPIATPLQRSVADGGADVDLSVFYSAADGKLTGGMVREKE